MNLIDVIIRITIAIIFAGVIGFDREFKNRPAGMRTHILVCIGAVLITLTQQQMATDSLALAKENPNLSNMFVYEQGRLVAQIISGIGFLGAGTIIVTKQSVFGLTTAASLWAVAGLGITIGMGYYDIAIVSFIAIMLVLTMIKKLIVVPTKRRVEIEFRDRSTKELIKTFFEEDNIKVNKVNFIAKNTDGEFKSYTNVYTITTPKSYDVTKIVDCLSENENILKVRLVEM